MRYDREHKHQDDSLSVRSVLVAVLLLRILCKISVGTLVYQCVKLVWVFPGVGGLVQRTGAQKGRLVAKEDLLQRRRGGAEGRAEFTE